MRSTWPWMARAGSRYLHLGRISMRRRRMHDHTCLLSVKGNETPLIIGSWIFSENFSALRWRFEKAFEDLSHLRGSCAIIGQFLVARTVVSRFTLVFADLSNSCDLQWNVQKDTFAARGRRSAVKVSHRYSVSDSSRNTYLLVDNEMVISFL